MSFRDSYINPKLSNICQVVSSSSKDYSNFLSELKDINQEALSRIEDLAHQAIQWKINADANESK